MNLADNVHRLVRPHLTQRPDGTYTQQDAYLDQLQLSQEQAQLVPTIVPAVLRALPIGDQK